MHAKTFYMALIPVLGVSALLVQYLLEVPEWVGTLTGLTTFAWFVCYLYATCVTSLDLLESGQRRREESPFVAKPWRAYGLGCLFAPLWALVTGLGVVNDH